MANDRIRQWLPYLFFLAAFFICCLASYFTGESKGYKRGISELTTKTDTIWRTDTHFVDRPVEKWHEVEKLVYVPVNDTTLIHVHDTTYVALEREIKGYSGDNYEAQVSGIQPELDWIKVFPKTAYIKETKMVKRRWTFGVTAGPGVLYNGQIHGGVGIVAGLQYNF